MSIHLFAIRHKPSGQFLGLGSRDSPRGATFRQPGDGEVRYFHRRNKATAALRTYCQGEWHKHTKSSGAFGEDVSVYAAPEKTTARPRDDFEVVEYALQEVQRP